MLTFQNVSKVYQGKYVLKDISFHVEKGEVVVLIGSSGCGKTTTLRLINRLTEPSEGRIMIDNRDSRKIDPIQLRLGIGYVIQKFGLIPHLTVAENIEIILYLKGRKKQERGERVRELLQLVNLSPEEYGRKMPHQLSGGQQQRVAIARALGADPEIILLDEPFSALDPVNRAQLQIELKSLQKRLQKTCVIVSHDMSEALCLGDRIICMHDGCIEQIGTPHDFLMHPASERVASFFQQASRLKHSDIIQAKDIAIPEFPRISIHCVLYEAAAVFDNTEEDFVIVMGEDSSCEGYLTGKEIKNYSLRTPIKQIPLRRKMPVAGNQSTVEVLKQFQMNRHLHFVPIENEQGVLLGIMTREGMLDYIVSSIAKERADSYV